jgi:hypothetical protein
MEILDKHFFRLPRKKKAFVIIIGTAFFIIALASYLSGLATMTESFLLFVVGILFSELVKMKYRVEALEK